MKKFKEFSEVARMEILALVVSVTLCAFALIGLAYNQIGWIIGVSIGSVIEMLTIFFLYKGSDMILKGDKVALFLVFYVIRMFLFIAGIVLCVIMQYGLKVVAFNYSFWGVLIGYTPMQVIVIVVMAKTGRTPLDMTGDKNK